MGPFCVKRWQKRVSANEIRVRCRMARKFEDFQASWYLCRGCIGRLDFGFAQLGPIIRLVSGWLESIRGPRILRRRMLLRVVMVRGYEPISHLRTVGVLEELIGAAFADADGKN